MRQRKLADTRTKAKKRGDSLYFTGNECLHGHVSPRYTVNASCQACTVAKAGAWLKENKAWVSSNAKARYRSNIVGTMLRAARHRAKKEGLPFDLTADYIKGVWPGDNCCPVLGLAFEIGSGKAQDASPSLDKLSPSGGYVVGNVAVISHLANRLKYNVSDPLVFRQLADWMESVKGN